MVPMKEREHEAGEGRESDGPAELHPMTIDGLEVAGKASFAVEDPATSRTIGYAPDCAPEDLDAAMDGAARAFADWREDENARRGILSRCADEIEGHVDSLARLLTLEQGKPLARASEEVQGAAAWFRITAELPIPVEVVQDDERARIEVHRRPLGVVAAITPWNYPFMLAAWKIAPALLAGNTVVLKPSPFTPLTTLVLGSLLRSVLPPGVLNTVSGGDETGAAMSSHPAVRKISFTGSIEAGKHVAAAAADDLKRVTLELGGNDPAIVLDDVDTPEIVERLFWGAFMNSGQVCSAIKRLYVPRSRHDDIVESLAERVERARTGSGLEPDVELGPLNNRSQLERVARLAADAERRGGRFVTGGGAIEGPGYYFAPTLVTDVDEEASLVTEEQFGPVLPVLSYDDVDDAVERANDTRYGLSGSVWSSDPERAACIATRLECGTTWVNQHMAILPHVPFGGLKWSGIGVENGPWGLLSFTEIQTRHVART